MCWLFHFIRTGSNCKILPKRRRFLKTSGGSLISCTKIAIDCCYILMYRSGWCNLVAANPFSYKFYLSYLAEYSWNIPKILSFLSLTIAIFSKLSFLWRLAQFFHFLSGFDTLGLQERIKKANRPVSILCKVNDFP